MVVITCLFVISEVLDEDEEYEENIDESDLRSMRNVNSESESEVDLTQGEYGLTQSDEMSEEDVDSPNDSSKVDKFMSQTRSKLMRPGRSYQTKLKSRKDYQSEVPSTDDEESGVVDEVRQDDSRNGRGRGRSLKANPKFTKKNGREVSSSGDEKSEIEDDDDSSSSRGPGRTQETKLNSTENNPRKVSDGKESKKRSQRTYSIGEVKEEMSRTIIFIILS